MRNIAEMIAKADFSAETDFKSVLRKRLFEKPSGVLRFTRLEDDELDWVSAAGDPDLLRNQETKKTDINKV